MYGLKQGAATEIAILLSGTALFSILMVFTDIPDIITHVYVILLLCAASYFGAYVSTQINRHHGLKQGVMCGVIAALPILVIGFIANGYISDFSLAKILFCMFFGIIGGVVGINTKRTKVRS